MTATTADAAELLESVFEAQREAESSLDDACQAAGWSQLSAEGAAASGGAQAHAYRRATAALLRAADTLGQLAGAPAGRDITPPEPGYTGPAITLSWRNSVAVAEADDPRTEPWLLVPAGLLDRLADAAGTACPDAGSQARALLGAATGRHLRVAR